MSAITRDELVDRIAVRAPSAPPVTRRVIKAVVDGVIAELESGVRVKSRHRSVIECNRPPVRAKSRSRNGASPGKERNLKSVRPRSPLRVPKVPRLIQDQLDGLIAKSKHGGLSKAEQAALDQLLDYLDDLTIHELERLTQQTADADGTK